MTTHVRSYINETGIGNVIK